MQTDRQRIALPEDVLKVLRNFYTAEVTTVGKDGTPVTWPISVRYLEDQGQFLMTSSIGMPGKIHNIRRDSRIALSYSDPTGTNLTAPPYVLVQGHATVDDTVRTSVDGLEDYWRETIFARQPKSKDFSSNAVMRWLMDWYYIRHVILVDPVRICWWPRAGSVAKAMQAIEVATHAHVG